MLNPVFLPYKNKHKGESCIFFGSGPSVEDYDNSLFGIRAGVNETMYKFGLDYFFIGDPKVYNRAKADYIKYLPNIAKFYRAKSINNGSILCIPDNIGNGYYIDNKKGDNDFSVDIADTFSAYASISFEMIQFLLYAGFEKIYLVGHDCDYKNGTFKTSTHKFDGNVIVNRWKVFKNWADDAYPEVNILSVNPVKLKMFEVYNA